MNRPLPETNIYSQSVIIDNIYDNQKTEEKSSEGKITEDTISNFEQKIKNYSEQELEEIAKKKYSKKIQELKILRN